MVVANNYILYWDDVKLKVAEILYKNKGKLHAIVTIDPTDNYSFTIISGSYKTIIKIAKKGGFTNEQLNYYIKKYNNWVDYNYYYKNLTYLYMGFAVKK
jgi:hypothetical protein